MEVVLMHDADTVAENPHAAYLANMTSAGGGEHDKKVVRSSPLPAQDSEEVDLQPEEQETRALRERIAAQEEALRQAILSLRGNVADASESDATSRDASTLKWSSRHAALEAEYQKYNSRPRKYFDGPDTQQHAAALYIQDWRHKVEQWSNRYYPPEARGKLYGQVVLTVEINAAGVPLNVQVVKSSGSRVLDTSAVASAWKSGPYGEFSAQMRKSMDILVLTRTWVFSQGDTLKNVATPKAP